MSGTIGRRVGARGAVAFGVLLLGLALLAVAASGAEPSPSPADVLTVGGDPRSDGAGPGLIGSPLLILAAVVLLGVATAAVTVLLARVASRD